MTISLQDIWCVRKVTSGRHRGRIEINFGGESMLFIEAWTPALIDSLADQIRIETEYP